MMLCVPSFVFICAAADLPEGMVRVNGRLVQAGASRADWQSSLSEIQQSAAGLLEVNRKLAGEHADLLQAIKTAEEAIAARQMNYESRLAELKDRQEQLKSPEDTVALMEKKKDLQRALLDKKRELSALEAQLKGADQRTALLRLRLSDLGLEKKSYSLGEKLAQDAALSGLQAKVDDLKNKINSNIEQEKFIRDRMARIERKDASFFKECRETAVRRAQLSAALAQTTARLRELRQKPSDSGARQGVASREPEVGQILALEKEKRDLTDQVEEARNKLARSGHSSGSPDRAGSDLKEKVASLEKQNIYIERENENLRENIAVLEYRMRSLQGGRNH